MPTLKKGSAAAKAFMAKLRAAKGKSKVVKDKAKTKVGMNATANDIKVTSNVKNRTFTIKKNGTTYRTGKFSKPEFEELEYNTQNDWANFLRTQDNYSKVKTGATKKVGYKSDRTQILTKATPYIKKYIDKGYSRTDAVKNANKDASNLSGWKKGTTNIIEVGEKKYPKQKNVRVTRIPNGTFEKFTSLSGYKQTPEIILGKVGAFTLLKSLAPEVKLRINRGKKVSTNKITSAKDISDILKKFLTAAKIQTQEYALAMFLNNNSNVLAVYQFGMGGFTSTIMDKRLLMAAALKLGATSIILAHNHPSGKLEPSKADKEITKDIIKIANLHQISVLDHVILTKDGYYSFAENGII